MRAFRFYRDRKVTCWERTHFEVTAENYEEAVALVKSWQGEDALCFEDNEKVIIRTEKHYMTPPKAYP